jgi:hypothetical protein
MQFYRLKAAHEDSEKRQVCSMLKDLTRTPKIKGKRKKEPLWNAISLKL